MFKVTKISFFYIFAQHVKQIEEWRSIQQQKMMEITISLRVNWRPKLVLQDENKTISAPIHLLMFAFKTCRNGSLLYFDKLVFV